MSVPTAVVRLARLLLTIGFTVVLGAGCSSSSNAPTVDATADGASDLPAGDAEVGSRDAGRGDGAAPSDAAPPGVDPGWVGIRRLSDAEYANTIQDLLGVSAQDWQNYGAVAVAPEAPSEGVAAFDNLAAQLTIEVPRYQQYFAAAVVLTDMAFADDALRARVVTCAPATPTDDTCARAVLHAIGLRAWRRPLAEAEVDGLVAVVHAAAAAGADFPSSIKQAVVALLISEAFLFRIELDPVPEGGGIRALTSYEIASRLSYLLWSTMPDDALFQLAAADQFTDPGVLTTQVTRMLADARSDGLVRNFFGQWLGFRALGGATLDRGPGWTAALQAAAGEEARHFVAEVVASDAELGALFTTDVNFVNDGLADLYGMPEPGSPDALVRISDTTDARAGVLGLAGLLAPMSEPTSSAPTSRGHWILEHLLCTDVPLPPDSFVVPSGTPREQAQMLSQLPACAGCHDLMDPVGLGLESFDRAGRFRARYAPADAALIDVSGRLPDGTPFEGLEGLEARLDADAHFFSCASRNALTYALGRALTPADDGALASIDAAWRGSGHTLRGLLAAIVVDDTFRLRNAKGQP
jgi:hypothetical protein